MIRSKDLNIEIKKMELAIEKGNDKELVKAVVKGIALMLKVVRDIKSNQVATMRKMNVEMMKPTDRVKADVEEKVAEKKAE